MNRTLVLMRHAKSSWADTGLTDFERPLNDRGRHDAPMMGERLDKHGLKPDLIIASPARRAAQTARKAAKAIGCDTNNIRWAERLYEGQPEDFEAVIATLPDEARTIWIIAHNPGITDYINQLSDNFRIDHLPTCAAIAARSQCPRWNQWHEAGKEVFLFEYPKKPS
jgi:phosphohistidine phosphatase